MGDLGLKWCKIFFKKNLIVETIQDKKIIFHYTLNGMAYWLGFFSLSQWICIQPPWCEAKGKMLKTKDRGEGGQRQTTKAKVF
jgi:hypothetical protein